MARKKIRKVPEKRISKKELKKISFSNFKFTESYTSFVLGAIVVLIVGILFVSFGKGNKNLQTSSTKDSVQIEKQNFQRNTSSTYTIKPGDDLWSISEDIYQDGYKWVEIAKINKLENPGLIHVGNKLMIPKISLAAAQKENVVVKMDSTVSPQNRIVQNNSILGNTYTIKKGDNLWDIAVRAYGDGFRWPEIAKANNLENPDLIFSDNVLKIPR